MVAVQQRSPAPARAPRLAPWLLVTLLTLAGAAWRLLLFSGDGLGDDHNFFLSYHGIFANSFWLKNAYNYRFVQWMPIWVAWRLFGVNEYTWVLPNTLASLAHIPLA